MFNCCCWFLRTQDLIILLFLWFHPDFYGSSTFTVSAFTVSAVTKFIWNYLDISYMQPAAQYLFFHFPPRLHIVTWNVATAEPPDDVSSLLHLNSPKSADLYVIGYGGF